MSMMHCDECELLFDTDLDTGCFIEEIDALYKIHIVCYCEVCREDLAVGEFELEDEDDMTCPYCLGTGIGQSGPPDVAVCYSCRGRGYYLPTKEY